LVWIFTVHNNARTRLVTFLRTTLRFAVHARLPGSSAAHADYAPFTLLVGCAVHAFYGYAFRTPARSPFSVCVYVRARFCLYGLRLLCRWLRFTSRCGYAHWVEHTRLTRTAVWVAFGSFTVHAARTLVCSSVHLIVACWLRFSSRVLVGLRYAALLPRGYFWLVAFTRLDGLRRFARSVCAFGYVACSYRLDSAHGLQLVTFAVYRTHAYRGSYSSTCPRHRLRVYGLVTATRFATVRVWFVLHRCRTATAYRFTCLCLRCPRGLTHARLGSGCRTRLIYAFTATPGSHVWVVCVCGWSGYALRALRLVAFAVRFIYYTTLVAHATRAFTAAHTRLRGLPVPPCPHTHHAHTRTRACRLHVA